MPFSDEQIKEKVIKHEYQFESLTKSLSKIVSELHEITTAMRSVAVITEQITNMDNNLKESFIRVHSKIDENVKDIKALKEVQDHGECHSITKTNGDIETLNRTVYGKDGRGGLLFDVEDIKKFMYKSMGFFTLLNLILGILVAYLTKG